MDLTKESIDRMFFGTKANEVTPSDDADLPGGPVKAVVVAEAGDLSVVPVNNGDEDAVTFTDAPVGFTPPFVVRRVMATGTTATVYTVED